MTKDFLKQLLGQNLLDIKFDSSQHNNLKIMGGSIDSRSVQESDLFFAFNGQNVDGNRYAQSAIDSGAAAVLMTDQQQYRAVKGNKILVSDVQQALTDIGRCSFQSYKGTKVAITGSYGKTSFKDMAHQVFGDRCFATRGSFNNAIGLPLTGLSLNSSKDIAIIEYGTNSLGEIAAQSELVQHDVAVILSIGTAHIGKFHSQSNIAKEKFSITNILKDNDPVIVNGNLREYFHLIGGGKVFSFGESGEFARLVKIESSEDKIVFAVTIEGKTYQGVIDHFYQHLAETASALMALGALSGYNLNEIIDSISEFQPTDGRGRIHNTGRLLIVDETFNSSFETIRSVVTAFAKTKRMPKYVLLGEIKQIDSFHKEIYTDLNSFLSSFFIDKNDYNKDLYFIIHCSKSSDMYRYIFGGNSSCTPIENIENFREHLLFFEDQRLLQEKLNNLEGSLLVKASRDSGFDRFIKELIESGD